MAQQVKHSDIKVGQSYGIQTWGGASSGLWLIAKVLKVSSKSVTYELKTGPTMTENKKCAIDDIFDAVSCAKESVKNRPEYTSSYSEYLA